MMLKQISAFVENKPGRLMEILQALADAKVDLKALSLADTTDFGVIRMIVSDNELAKKVLKEDGVVVRITDITAVAVPDEPGALLDALKILSDNGVAIEYMYAFGEKLGNSSVIAIRTEDPERTEQVLRNGGIVIPSDSEIEKM
ncbi:MAG: acetolactate synthase [Clostridia bacterium]|nr:acetolactate synthase [Clostridia bacterium]